MSEFNKIKEISAEDLEKAIAKTISELLNRKYECSISNITYDVFDKADFQVSIYLHNDLMSRTEKGD